MGVKERIVWIDELKGFVMIAICMHHVCDMIQDFNNTHIQSIAGALTTLGVPSFFFISGLLFNPLKHRTLKLYFNNKITSLLLPYFYLSLMFSFLDPNMFSFSWLQSLGYPRTQLFEHLGLTDNLAAPIEWFCGNIVCTLIGVSSRATLPLWFVFTLFFVTITYFILNLSIKKPLLLYMVCFSSIIFAFICDYFNIGTYIHIGAYFAALFFYTFGVFFNRIKDYINQQKLLKSFFFIICSIVLYLFLPYTIGKVDVVSSRFCIDYPIHFLIVSISGIYIFVCFFEWFSLLRIQPFSFIRSLLRYIGKHSLIILAVHYWALVLYFLFIQPFISSQNSIISVFFIFVTCFLCIPLFRVYLYRFIGGKRAQMSFNESVRL